MLSKIMSMAQFLSSDLCLRYCRFVHLLLLSSERAWAHAMHMKSVHSADTAETGTGGSTRRHIISRLSKAATYADQLVQVLEDQAETRASNVDILEARAYAASLSGALQFEKQKWEECLQRYSIARVIYAALSTSTRKEIFKDLLSGTVDPSIRYAAYQLKLPRTLASSTIAVQRFPNSDAEVRAEVEKVDPDAFTEEAAKGPTGVKDQFKDVPQTISWRKRTVKIEDASIAQALATAGAAEVRLSSFLQETSNKSLSPKEKAAAYDNVIIASQDAVDATKTAIDELVKEGIDQSDTRMQSLQVTRTAVNYALVGWRVGRNRVLCSDQDGSIFESEKPKQPRKPKKDGKPWMGKEEGTGRKLARLRERVALYDAILQSLDSVGELPGVAGDSAFMQELDEKRAYFQALRYGVQHFSRCFGLIHLEGAFPSPDLTPSCRSPRTL